MEHPRPAGADGRRDGGPDLRHDPPVLRSRRRLHRRPRPGAHARHRRDRAPQQPRRAARTLLHRRAVVPRQRPRGRAHPLARPRGRRGRSGLRGEDGRGAARGARHDCRVGVGGAAQPRQRPAGRRRGDDCHRTGLAAPHVADSGGRPPVDLRHERQQHLVADPRLQRPRPPVRAGRRTRRHGRRRHHVRRRARPAATAQRGARRAGRLAARGRARRRRRAARAHPTEAGRRAHRLADRGRRHVPDDRRRLQPRGGDLPSLLRGPARAVHGRARRRDRRGHARATASSRPRRWSRAWRPR